MVYTRKTPWPFIVGLIMVGYAYAVQSGLLEPVIKFLNTGRLVGEMQTLGYCFGGGVVLNMARQGADLKGVASFHGSLVVVKPAQPGSVTAKIRVYNGADDKFTTPEAIEAFKKEMTDASADFQFINYPGAIHSFTNPEATELGKKFNLPLAYNADADTKSWEDMKAFFTDIFRK